MTGRIAPAGTLSKVAADLARARRVLVIPGFGLAAARAQVPLLVLDRVLREAGTEVDYVIHPLAGRLPGQLNAVLAEVDRSRQHTSEQIDVSAIDVVLTVGAKDVINPRADLPALDLTGARRLVILNRSAGPGFGGVDNPLLQASDAAAPTVTVLIGELNGTLTRLVAELARSSDQA